jgi:hypothetical protein
LPFQASELRTKGIESDAGGFPKGGAGPIVAFANIFVAGTRQAVEDVLWKDDIGRNDRFGWRRKTFHEMLLGV